MGLRKDNRLERTLPSLPTHEAPSEEETLRRLEAFLKPRLEEAERGERAGTLVESSRLVPTSVTERPCRCRDESTDWRRR